MEMGFKQGDAYLPKWVFVGTTFSGKSIDYVWRRHVAAEPIEEKRSTPQTPEEWVENLVDQMSQAKTMDEARQRAAQVLQAFERAVLEHAQVMA